jgi:chromosome segregation ATPase
MRGLFLFFPRAFSLVFPRDLRTASSQRPCACLWAAQELSELKRLKALAEERLSADVADQKQAKAKLQVQLAQAEEALKSAQARVAELSAELQSLQEAVIQDKAQADANQKVQR